MDKKIFGSLLLAKKKIGSLKKLLLKILLSEVRKGGFQLLWKMVLWGATFNAVVVVGVVSLLLFRSPMAILWLVRKKSALHNEVKTNLKSHFHFYTPYSFILQSQFFVIMYMKV
jgi:hypothetical protein